MSNKTNKTFHLTFAGVNKLLSAKGFRELTTQSLKHFREGQIRVVQLKSGEKVYEYPAILKQNIDFEIKKKNKKPVIFYADSAIDKIKNHLKRTNNQ